MLRLASVYLVILSSLSWTVATLIEYNEVEKKNAIKMRTMAQKSALENLARQQAQHLLGKQVPQEGGKNGGAVNSQSSTSGNSGGGNGRASSASPITTAESAMSAANPQPQQTSAFSRGTTALSRVTMMSSDTSSTFPEPILFSPESMVEAAAAAAPSSEPAPTSGTRASTTPLALGNDVRSSDNSGFAGGPPGTSKSDYSDSSFGSMTTVANSPNAAMSGVGGAGFGSGWSHVRGGAGGASGTAGVGLYGMSSPRSESVKAQSVYTPEVLLNYQIEIEPYGVGVVRRVVRKLGRTTRYEVIFPNGVGVKVLKLKRGRKGNVPYKLLQKL